MGTTFKSIFIGVHLLPISTDSYIPVMWEFVGRLSTESQLCRLSFNIVIMLMTMIKVMKIMKYAAQTNLSLKNRIQWKLLSPKEAVLLGSDKLTWPLACSLTLGKLFTLAKPHVPDLEK